MKLIICGGRHYQFNAHDFRALDKIRHLVTEVVSGRATGADTCGERWADSRGIPVKPFPAKWGDLSHPDALIKTRADGSRYDARAGFRRNREMAKYAGKDGMCYAFPGDDGTTDMIKVAREFGVTVTKIDYRGELEDLI